MAFIKRIKKVRSTPVPNRLQTLEDAMFAGHLWFLHMDRDWMHRVCLANAKGKVIARSKTAYFSKEEADQALAFMMYSAMIRADAA